MVLNWIMSVRNLNFEYVRAVEGNRLPDMIASGQQLDLFFDARGIYEENLFKFGLQYDMTELAKTHQIDLEQFEPVLKNEALQASGGKLYMLPFQTNQQILFYNKGLFEKFGADYPVDGMTWDEMLDLAKSITRKEGDQLYFGFSNQLPVHVINYNQLSLTRVDTRPKCLAMRILPS